jgi:hypothetical protein
MTEQSDATKAPYSVSEATIKRTDTLRNFWEHVEGKMEVEGDPVPDQYIGKNPLTNQFVSFKAHCIMLG